MMHDESTDADREFPAEDSALLETLRRLSSRVDPVPASVIAAARASHDWRRIDSELARLTYDSVLDDTLAGVRAMFGGARQLTFESTRLTLEVEVAPDRAGINGQVVPPQAAKIEVRHSQGSLRVKADDLGHFRASALPTGPLSLRCLPDAKDSPAMETEWIVM